MAKEREKKLKRDGAPSAAALAEIEKAAMAVRRGNVGKAVRLMEEQLGKPQVEPAIIQAYMEVSLKLGDKKAKQKHVKLALEAAKRAVDEFPESESYYSVCFFLARGTLSEEDLSDYDRSKFHGSFNWLSQGGPRLFLEEIAGKRHHALQEKKLRRHMEVILDNGDKEAGRRRLESKMLKRKEEHHPSLGSGEIDFGKGPFERMEDDVSSHSAISNQLPECVAMRGKPHASIHAKVQNEKENDVQESSRVAQLSQEFTGLQIFQKHKKKTKNFLKDPRDVGTKDSTVPLTQTEAEAVTQTEAEANMLHTSQDTPVRANMLPNCVSVTERLAAQCAGFLNPPIQWGTLNITQDFGELVKEEAPHTAITLGYSSPRAGVSPEIITGPNVTGDQCSTQENGVPDVAGRTLTSIQLGARIDNDLRTKTRVDTPEEVAGAKGRIKRKARRIPHESNGSLEKQYEGLSRVKGLKNATGEYNCFINVVVQALYNLHKFRNVLLSSNRHSTCENACVACSLKSIFICLSTHKETCAQSSSLRAALSTVYADSNLFQLAQMNDASEALLSILACLHNIFQGECSEGYSKANCIAHGVFGLDIYEYMTCETCHMKSRARRYTTMFYNLNAFEFREAKKRYSEEAMDKVFGLMHTQESHACCDREDGGCGASNIFRHELRAQPYVFTIVVGWQSDCESREDISATINGFSTSIDVGLVYNLKAARVYSLVSLICFYGKHYQSFCLKEDGWIMQSDAVVKAIGSWDDVVKACCEGHLQPQVLFYEAKLGKRQFIRRFQDV